MKVPSSIELIQKNKAMYLGDEEPSGRLLAIRLADCALISGASRVEVLALEQGWMAVSSDSDWITPSLPRRENASLERAFLALIPLHGGRQNEVRFEVIVSAFSSSLSVKSGDRWSALVGELVPQKFRDHVANSEFAVVFKAALPSMTQQA